MVTVGIEFYYWRGCSILLYISPLELLYTTPVDDSMKTIPSPEELKGKIIVKAKKSSEIKTDDFEPNYSSDDDNDEKSCSSDDDSGNSAGSITQNIPKSHLVSTSVKKISLLKYVPKLIFSVHGKKLKTKQTIH